MFSMKFALKSVPDLAAIGVLHGGEDGSLFGIFMASDFKGHETKLQQWPIRYMQRKFRPIRQETAEIPQKGCQGICLAFAEKPHKGCHGLH